MTRGMLVFVRRRLLQPSCKVLILHDSADPSVSNESMASASSSVEMIVAPPNDGHRAAGCRHGEGHPAELRENRHSRACLADSAALELGHEEHHEVAGVERLPVALHELLPRPLLLSLRRRSIPSLAKGGPAGV